MSTLHIVQGGIENGDKAWLEKAARLRLNIKSWIAPKSASIGDEVVIFIVGYGLFATARIASRAKPRPDWGNRYGADLTSIRLIKPAISLAVLRQAIPELKWANYPRSITTPPPKAARRIWNLVARRRKTRLPDFKDEVVKVASLDELRELALSCARSIVASKRRSANHRIGSQAIHRYVLCRANGRCEGCNAMAPFRKSDGSLYLEPHHTTRLADDGPDHPARVIGLCPNCHRRAHYATDARSFNNSLKKRLRDIESDWQ